MLTVYALPILIAAFAGITIPACMLPLSPILTVKFLEHCNLLQENEVLPGREMHLTRGGYARQALVYKYTDMEKQFDFATEKVIIRFFSISMILCVCVGTIVATVLRFRVS